MTPLSPFVPCGPAVGSLQFSGWFSRKEPTFKPQEANSLAKAMLAQVPDAAKQALQKDKVDFSPEAISQAILKGVRQPIEHQEFRFGILMPNGQIKSKDKIFQKIGAYLIKRIPGEMIPPEGLAIVVRERGQDTTAKVKTFLEDTLTPYFRVKADVPTVETSWMDAARSVVNKVARTRLKTETRKNIEVFQTVPWPFFNAVAGGQPLSADYERLAKAMDDLPLFELGAPVDPQQQARLQSEFLPLRQRLAALESATTFYSDDDIHDVYKVIILGALIGGGGEFLTHHFVEGHGNMAGVARAGTLVMVDVIDGVLGEAGVIKADLKANGLGLMEGLYGRKEDGSKKSWWDIMKHPFSFKGPGKIFFKRAGMSALKGAGVGAMLSTPAGFVMSDPSASVLERALVGGVGTVGTATSVPFNMRASIPQAYLATRVLMAQGKIPVPAALQGNEKELKKYAMRIAQQDVLSRLGFAASMKAYAMTPISGLILASEGVGIPREVAQGTYMAVAPAMENLIRMVLTMGRLKMTNPHNMAKAEHMVLNAMDRPFTDKEGKRLGRLFADRFTRGVSWAMTHLPWRTKLPVLDQARLDSIVPFQEQPKSEKKPTEPSILEADAQIKQS